jgi:DNA ligase D-like protein (predicted ligase)
MECASGPLPDGPGWAYEVKWDGFRALGSPEWLLSRHGKPLNFRPVRDALRELASGTMLDGEVVTLDESGRPSFGRLQSYKHGDSVLYYAFDILSLKGKSLLKTPWVERREILQAILPSNPLLRLSDSFDSSQTNAAAVIKTVREFNLEGAIAKRRDSFYEPGKRSGAWIKQRIYQGQEFVVGGFTSGPHGIDAIVIGYYEGDDLIFVARTRNGFVPDSRRKLYQRLKPLIRKKCPFSNLPEPRSLRFGEGLTAEKMSECTWVKPEIVVQIDYTEWTEANHLRHSFFKGIRDDKRAREVVRERGMTI